MKREGEKIKTQKKYMVKVRGSVSDRLADYYDGITLRIKGEDDDQPETELIGWFPDQIALLGLLNRLHEWGHALLYVEYITVE